MRSVSHAPAPRRSGVSGVGRACERIGAIAPPARKRSRDVAPGSRSRVVRPGARATRVGRARAHMPAHRGRTPDGAGKINPKRMTSRVESVERQVPITRVLCAIEPLYDSRHTTHECGGAQRELPERRRELHAARIAVEERHLPADYVKPASVARRIEKWRAQQPPRGEPAPLAHGTEHDAPLPLRLT